MKLDDLLEEKKKRAEDQKLSKEPYIAKKPNLITRYAAALLDLIVTLLMIVGFFFACRYTILDPMGHQDDVDFVHNACAESSLFVESNGGYYEVTDEGKYDSSKTPEQNYELRIVYYYTNCDYPIQLKMKDTYFAEKTAAKYWKELIPDERYSLEKGSTMEQIEAWMNSHYQRVEGFEDTNNNAVVGFLSKQYESAIAKFVANPEYVKHTTHATLTEYFIVLISEILALGIYYILLPLVLKRGATPFKLVFKIAVIDKYGLKLASKMQILLRYFVLIVINFIIPTIWYFFMPSVVGYLAMLFPMAEIMFLGISHSNSGIHDYAARTYLADFKDKRLVLKGNNTLLGTPEKTNEPETRKANGIKNK